MANEMFNNIEMILKDTDEIKQKLEQRGLKPLINIESNFTSFDFNFTIYVKISY